MGYVIDINLRDQLLKLIIMVLGYDNGEPNFLRDWEKPIRTYDMWDHVVVREP